MIDLTIESDKSLDLSLFLLEIKQAPIAVAEILFEEVKRNFLIEKDPYGDSWAPLAQSTIQSKLSRGVVGSILVDSGEMLNSLHIVKSEDYASISISSPAEFHQAGTSRMPQRLILPDVELPSEWVQIIEQTIVKKVLKSLQ